MMNDVINIVQNCKKLDNLLKNVLENFKYNDERFENVNRERLRVVDRYKFIIINNFCKFCF